MKHFLFTAAIAMLMPIGANAAICMSYAECSSGCGNGQFDDAARCCSTERTFYSCPSGWRATGKTCTRNNTDAGNDSKGYLATTYGTCDATPETQTCYMCSMSGCL